MGCGDVRLLKTIGSVDFTGQERAALNKLTMPLEGMARGGCGPSPAAPTPPELGVLPEFITYEGKVVEPAAPDGHSWLRFETGVTGIPGFRVTIVGGQPNGWTAVTDAEGRFAFENYPLLRAPHVRVPGAAVPGRK